MKYLILMISASCFLHAGQSTPSYSGGYGSGAHNGHSGAEHAPIGYHGPIAIPHVLSDGHIADTPEVSAAKHQHYLAIHKAQVEASAHGYSGDDGSYGSGTSYGSGAGYGASYGSGAGFSGGYSYSGPLAYPKVLPSGLLADTHEVAAAKHAHFNAVAVTARQQAEKWTNNYNH